MKKNNTKLPLPAKIVGAPRPYTPTPPQPYQWEFAETDGQFFAPSDVFHTTLEVLTLKHHIPTVFVSPLALFKMYVIVGAINIEVGWLGTARRLGEDFIIDDVFLFPQTVSGGHTEILPEALQEFVMEILSKEGGDEIFNNIRFWGHSHGNGGTYPSGQDNDQMKIFQSFGTDFFLRGILNRQGDINFGIYDWEKGFAFHSVPWKWTEEDIDDWDKLDEIRNDLREEMKRKVTALRFAPYSPPFFKGFGGKYKPRFFRKRFR
ncbi:MAG: hypothetical protein WC087_01000 [Candidatus Paceibacterota bacterium]